MEIKKLMITPLKLSIGELQDALGVIKFVRTRFGHTQAHVILSSDASVSMLMLRCTRSLCRKSLTRVIARILHVLILVFLLVLILFLICRLPSPELVPPVLFICIADDFLEHILSRSICYRSLPACGLRLILLLLLLKPCHHPIMSLLLRHLKVHIEILRIMVSQ
jgi:hypothetical protein